MIRTAQVASSTLDGLVLNGDPVPDPLELAGKQLGGYTVERFVAETPKSCVYRSHDLGLDTAVALKIAKPGRNNENRFTQERTDLTRLKHANIVGIYGAGEDQGLSYLVLEWIDGPNLRKAMVSGRTFSLEETLLIGGQMLSALDFARTKDIPHTDVKPENIILRDDGSICMVDIGFWSDSDPLRNDVSGTALVLRELLEHSEVEIPRRLSSRLNKANRGKYNGPGDFKKAVDGYLRNDVEKIRPLGVIGPQVSRRTFVQAATSVAAFGAASIWPISHSRSLAHIVNKLRRTDPSDLEQIKSDLLEFGERAAHQKILPVHDDEKVKDGLVPFATDKEGDWHIPDAIKSTSGRWYRILNSLGSLTGDSRFTKLADQTADHLGFREGEEMGFAPVRCLHTGRDLVRAAAYFDSIYEAETGIYDFAQVPSFEARFDTDLGENERIIGVSSLDSILPLVLAASEQTQDTNFSALLFDRAVSHTEAAARYLVREDGSTIDLARFNPETREVTEGNYFAVQPNSCHTRFHVGAINWFATMYEQTGNESWRGAAQKLLEFYTSRLPSDLIPNYDIFYDPNRPNNGMPEDVPKETAAASRMCEVLMQHTWLLPDQERRALVYRTLRSVVINHADTDPDSDAIITGMCDSYRTRDYMNSCIVRGLDSFFRSLELI